MRSRFFDDEPRGGARQTEAALRRIRNGGDSSQSAVLGELALTLAGFLAVAIAGTLLATQLLH